jgi:hypothetical protein
MGPILFTTIVTLAMPAAQTQPQMAGVASPEMPPSNAPFPWAEHLHWGFDFSWGQTGRTSSVDIAGADAKVRDIHGTFLSIAFSPFLIFDGQGHVGWATGQFGLVYRQWTGDRDVLAAFPGIRWESNGPRELGLRLTYSGGILLASGSIALETTWSTARRVAPVLLTGATASEIAIASQGERVAFPAAITTFEFAFGTRWVDVRVGLSRTSEGDAWVLLSAGIPLGVAFRER